MTSLQVALAPEASVGLRRWVLPVLIIGGLLAVGTLMAMQEREKAAMRQAARTRRPKARASAGATASKEAATPTSAPSDQSHRQPQRRKQPRSRTAAHSSDPAAVTFVQAGSASTSASASTPVVPQKPKGASAVSTAQHRAKSAAAAGGSVPASTPSPRPPALQSLPSVPLADEGLTGGCPGGTLKLVAPAPCMPELPDLQTLQDLSALSGLALPEMLQPAELFIPDSRTSQAGGAGLRSATDSSPSTMRVGEWTSSDTASPEYSSSRSPAAERPRPGGGSTHTSPNATAIADGSPASSHPGGSAPTWAISSSWTATSGNALPCTSSAASSSMDHGAVGTSRAPQSKRRGKERAAAY
jgi:hypothetical protein